VIAFALRRLGRAVPALATIVVVTFVLIQAAPGSAADVLAGSGGDQSTVEYLRTYLQLDRPLWRQLLAYVGHLARGDLGRSFVQGGTPVSRLIGDRLPATLLLMGSALVISSLVGVLLGAWPSRKPYGRFDLALSTTSIVAYAVPVFWSGQLALLVFAFHLGWFPIQGMTDARQSLSGISHGWDVARHLVLPAIVLAASELALVSRVTRSGLLGERPKDYLRTARAKGVSERRVMFAHALPNALLPVVTVVGNRVGFIFTGAVITESVFGWPGLGTLVVNAAQSRDRPVLLGIVILVSVAVVVANLVTDLVYAWIDPRIRYA